MLVFTCADATYFQIAVLLPGWFRTSDVFDTCFVKHQEAVCGFFFLPFKMWFVCKTP